MFPFTAYEKIEFFENYRLTTWDASGIMQSNFKEKPLNKRSKRDGNLSESRGWWDHGRVRFGEWTCEGRANRERSRSSEDGDRTRYQGGTHQGCVAESGRLRVNLGGTAG